MASPYRTRGARTVSYDRGQCSHAEWDRGKALPFALAARRDRGSSRCRRTTRPRRRGIRDQCLMKSVIPVITLPSVSSDMQE